MNDTRGVKDGREREGERMEAYAGGQGGGGEKRKEREKR